MTWFLFAIIVGLGVYRLVVYYKKVKTYYKVKGIIVGHDVKEVDDQLMGKKYFYSPIVDFTDKYNREQRMICGEDNPDRPLYKVGANITLLVHPDDSSRFLMYDFISGILIPIIWIIIGIAIPLIPIIWPETFAE
jgi:hypothetical protein